MLQESLWFFFPLTVAHKQQYWSCNVAGGVQPLYSMWNYSEMTLSVSDFHISLKYWLLNLLQIWWPASIEMCDKCLKGRYFGPNQTINSPMDYLQAQYLSKLACPCWNCSFSLRLAYNSYKNERPLMQTLPFSDTRLLNNRLALLLLENTKWTPPWAPHC